MPKSKTHFEHLRDKWTSKHRKLSRKLWKKHGKALNWALDKSKKVAVGVKLRSNAFNSFSRCSIKYSTPVIYKYRKMLLVNPDNGKSIITDIADSGPAEWTGKHLGGSPEVMKYLERVDGAQRGPVLYFFIDDPEDKIPLGQISVK